MRDCFYLRQLKKLDLQQSNRYSNLEYRRASIKRSGAHCMKSVQIRSFFWSSFCCIRTEYGREKTPYLDTFHVVAYLIFDMLDRGIIRGDAYEGKCHF